MSQKISPILHPEDLIPVIRQREAFVLIDASAGSKARYDENHLEGALYADLNTDLAAVKPDFAAGGRHPLPTLEQFSGVLARLGISENSHVVIYDDKNGSNAAARFWWMLKSAGHQKVQVLDGGFDAAIQAGFPTSAKSERPKTAEPYKIRAWQLPVVEMNEVEQAAKNSGRVVIDVRDANRFAGLTEPIDLIAGHIPGAVNIPFTENLNENGFFLEPETLKRKYSDLVQAEPENVIVHCGSGVTACHTLLAMDYAGLEIPALYVGSWSEWSRNNKEMVLASL